MSERAADYDDVARRKLAREIVHAACSEHVTWDRAVAEAEAALDRYAEARVAEAVGAEREACARIADTAHNTSAGGVSTGEVWRRAAASAIAAQIRQRAGAARGAGAEGEGQA